MNEFAQRLHATTSIPIPLIITIITSLIQCAKQEDEPNPARMKLAVQRMDRRNPRRLRLRIARRAMWEAEGNLDKEDALRFADETVKEILNAPTTTVTAVCKGV